MSTFLNSRVERSGLALENVHSCSSQDLKKKIKMAVIEDILMISELTFDNCADLARSTLVEAYKKLVEDEARREDTTAGLSGGHYDG